MQPLQSLHRQITSNLILVFSFVLIGKLAGAAKELAIAWRFGVSETVDAYLFVFNITQWPIAILGGVLTSVLIPLAVRLRGENDLHLARFRSEVFGVSALVLVLISLILAIVLPGLVLQPWLGLTPNQANIASEIAPVIASAVFFAGIAQLYSVWVMVIGSHINSLIEAVPAILILLFVLAWQGVSSLVWGTVLGFALQAGILHFYLNIRNEVSWLRFSMTSVHWKVFLSGMGMMLIGQTLSTLTSLIDQFYAAHLGAGALSTLGYANRVLALILSLGALVISRALLPVLAKSYRENHATTNSMVYRWSAIIFLAALLVTIFCLYLAPQFIGLLFERGAFTALDTSRVAEIFQYSAVQIPFYCLSMVAVYALLSQGQYRVVALLGAINLVVKIGLALALTEALGLRGLVLSTTGVYLVSGLVALLCLSRTVARI
ncbi:MAG: lipid II flippase MurJ [Pseudomonadota bacterium]